MVISILAIATGSFVIVATLIPLINKEQWWIRIFDFPRLQIVAIGIFSLLSSIISWQNEWPYYVIVPLVVAALIYQFTMIFPYTSLAKKQVITCKESGEHPVFSIMVMNVYMHNRNVDGAIKIIGDNQPDILITVETDHWWNNNLGILKKDYHYHVLVPIDNTYGMAMYSKLKLIDPEVKYVYLDDIPSIHTKVQMSNGEMFKLYAVHPKPPIPGESDTSIHRDAELVTVGKETRNDEGPVIVAGDLNDVAWSFTTNLFQRYSELLDPRIGRGMFNTYHAKHKLMRWPLDHIFHSDHFQLLEIRTLPYFGSDHFPIYVKLCYLPSKQHEQEEPKANGEDLKQANERISKAKKM